MSNRKQRWLDYRTKFTLHARFILSFTAKQVYDIRNDFSSRYISGDGFEIGAQNSPVICSNANTVKYIDYLTRKESEKKYKIPKDECVHVDVIADANKLDSIPSSSASFIIANHVLEHSPNPIATLLGWLRILEQNGILFLTLPNYKANEFDFEKKPATIEHLVQDHENDKNNIDISTEHIIEHIQLIDGIERDNTKVFEKRLNEIIESKLHTHYHVFNEKNAIDLLATVHQLQPIRIENSCYFENSIELLFIIRKVEPTKKGPLIIKKDRLFNFAILTKHMMLFLLNRLVMKWKRI